MSDKKVIENLARIVNDLGAKLKERPEVVRCKDCRFSILIPPCNQRKCDGAMEKIVSDDFFCADGERKDGECNG